MTSAAVGATGASGTAPEASRAVTEASRAAREPALLVLADGEVFEGEAAGARRSGPTTGELVFNTVMSGYQEVLTDPSYAGQVIAFTYPHIGNYGVTGADSEAQRPQCRAVVARDIARRPSNWRSEDDLDSWLAARGVPAIVGVDTRRLTRHVRDVGAIGCALGPVSGPGATSESELRAAATAEPGTTGADLISSVTTPVPYERGAGPYTVVAYDYGIKESILAQLASRVRVQVVPARTPATEVLARCPDGVLLSNGPGDPAALDWAVTEIGALIGRVPVFGICLGHQLMARALGGATFKLAFGHHGGNHPVRHLETGAVEITSQNHNYAISPDGLEGVEITHVNLNDGVVEGFAAPRAAAFGVQYHPEAGPGPHDARYLFDRFCRVMGETAR